MKFRIKHIATRFLAQSIFTILIIAILIFIMFYSGNRKKDTLKVISLVGNVKSNLVISKINLEKAFDLQTVDPNFVESSCDILLGYQENIFSQIEDTINVISNIKYLEPYINRTNLIDTINLELIKFSRLYSKTLLSLKEKGNHNGGLVADAVDAINNVATELSFAPDKGLQAAKFSSYTSAYLTDLSFTKLHELILFCDELVTPFYLIDNFDISNLEIEVFKLKGILHHIQQIDLRLHDRQNQKGQLVDVNRSYTHLTSNFERFALGIQDETDVYNAWWNWIFTILAITLTIAYILVMGRFSQVVHKSVKTLHRITKSLADGSIKDNVPEGGHYEFNAFNRDLKSFFTLLNARKGFIEQLLSDNFEAKLELKTDNDKIGTALLKLQEKMKQTQVEQEKHNQENAARRYINEGLAKFSDIMRLNNHDTNVLADEFIKEFVKYMGAMQGALFLLQEQNDNLLDLSSLFAFDRKRYEKRTIKLGEGLVGTCAIEQKTINLTEIPSNYIQIKSGLGDTPPNNIMVIPVMNDEVLIGVIELASLKIFKNIEIELSENIASSLASTIITARNNSKTAQLLKKSQEQAAEMAEQEEEMRQNMEELKATQEESSRREEEMQGILSAIGVSFYVMEYDISGNIVHVNDRVISFVEQSLDLILQRKHHDIFSTESVITEELITTLVDEKMPQSLTEKLNWGSKKYTYKYNLSPVFNSSGEVIKVLNLFSIDEIKTKS